MIHKPDLSKATVVKDLTDQDLDKLKKLAPDISQDVLDYLKEHEGKEIGGDVGINARYTILSKNTTETYAAFDTKGVSHILSMFRMVGGCNHVNEFVNDATTEKSSDYDSIPASRILDLPSYYGMAARVILENYIGKTFRVIARTGPETAPFGSRYYLFAIEG